MEVGAVGGGRGGGGEHSSHITPVLEVAALRHAVVARCGTVTSFQADGGSGRAVQPLVFGLEIYTN